MIADHLGLGVKSGKPYVFHSKASDPYANWKVEVKGIDWQARDAATRVEDV